jgi:hypothetical protein
LREKLLEVYSIYGASEIVSLERDKKRLVLVVLLQHTARQSERVTGKGERESPFEKAV